MADSIGQTGRTPSGDGRKQGMQDRNFARQPRLFLEGEQNDDQHAGDGSPKDW